MSLAEFKAFRHPSYVLGDLRELARVNPPSPYEWHIATVVAPALVKQYHHGIATERDVARFVRIGRRNVRVVG